MKKEASRAALLSKEFKPFEFVMAGEDTYWGCRWHWKTQ